MSKILVNDSEDQIVKKDNEGNNNGRNLTLLLIIAIALFFKLNNDRNE